MKSGETRTLIRQHHSRDGSAVCLEQLSEGFSLVAHHDAGPESSQAPVHSAPHPDLRCVQVSGPHLPLRHPSPLVSHLRYFDSSAGVDRGLRHSMVVSVKNGDDTYEETMIGRQGLFEKREKLRQQTRVLMSQIARKRNNWEKKHARQQPPAIILKKEKELESLWHKVRRLDKEISHQVAAETVWFCEQHDVKTIYFEDLRSFQGKRGMKRHSWNLSTNLWGMMIEGVRYRREALGHRNGGIWLVNPAWTSQTCHVCRERGIRVEDETSTTEQKGGEYFHCPQCDVHFHADVNAARNIMYVQQSHKPSAVSGRTA